jgi:hypothetical protein
MCSVLTLQGGFSKPRCVAAWHWHRRRSVCNKPSCKLGLSPAFLLFDALGSSGFYTDL